MSNPILYYTKVRHNRVLGLPPYRYTPDTKRSHSALQSLTGGKKRGVSPRARDGGQPRTGDTRHPYPATAHRTRHGEGSHGTGNRPTPQRHRGRDSGTGAHRAAERGTGAEPPGREGRQGRAANSPHRDTERPTSAEHGRAMGRA